jgi:hypothetical protein
MLIIGHSLDQPMQLNIKRGLIRVWAGTSIVWILLVVGTGIAVAPQPRMSVVEAPRDVQGDDIKAKLDILEQGLAGKLSNEVVKPSPAEWLSFALFLVALGASFPALAWLAGWWLLWVLRGFQPG